MGRLDYQRQWAVGRIVNLGCGDDPAGFGERATHVDIDVWALPNFVKADLHDLPILDRSFDTAILGDVLEHVMDPEQVVREAARVARQRLVITVPEETTLPGVGRHVERGLADRAALYRGQHGDAAVGLTDEEVVVLHKRTDPTFVHAHPEALVPHDGHIWRFDEEWIDRLVVAAAGFKVVDRQKAPECSWWNWLLCLDR